MMVCCVPLETGLGSWAAPYVPAVELSVMVLVCPWQEGRKLTMPPTSPLPLVCPNQREVCPQPSCDEGSGKMSLAHCTAAPVGGGKSRGLDTKVTVASVLPLISPTMSAVEQTGFKPFSIITFLKIILLHVFSDCKCNVLLGAFGLCAPGAEFWSG